MGVLAPLIYPLDCLVIGDAIGESAERLLYCWGYSRETNTDPTRLLCEASPGSLSAPSYSSMHLQYLGYRPEPEKLLTYFGTHFKLVYLDEKRLVFVTGPELQATHLKISDRWPSSKWYFIFPRGTEGLDRAVKRKKVWDSWRPSTSEKVLSNA